MRGLSLLLVLFAAGAEVRAGDGLEARMTACLASLDGVDAFVRGTYPPGLIAADRKLRGLRDNVDRKRETLALTRRLAGERATYLDRHLFENAIQGCERFVAEYRKRGRLFGMMVTAVGILVLLLTARLGLAIVTAGKAAHETPPPSDRDRAA